MNAAGVKSALLPVAHLDAEVIAAPLVTSAGFSTALITLDQRIHEATGGVWRETESSLLSRFPGTSVDELVARRDRAWFQDPGVGPLGQVPLHAFLCAAANRVLKVGFGQASSSAQASTSCGEDQTMQDLRVQWRWLTFALPPDLLLAAANADRSVPELLCPTLSRRLRDKGFAETHLHLKAAVSFSNLWVATLRAIGGAGAREGMFTSPGADFDEGRNLAPWLLRAAVARLFLAAYLSKTRILGFAQWLNSHALPAVRATLGPVSAGLVRRALRQLVSGSMSGTLPAFGSLRSIYAHLSGVNRRPFPATLAAVPGEERQCSVHSPRQRNCYRDHGIPGPRHLDEMSAGQTSR